MTLLASTAVLNQDIQDWQRLPVAQKTWQHFQTFFQQAHNEIHKAFTIPGQGGYNVEVNNAYDLWSIKLFHGKKTQQIIPEKLSKASMINKTKSIDLYKQTQWCIRNATVLTTMNEMIKQIQALQDQ